jgi:ParB family transcriptional regulator, chromosome partitioning protein
MGKFKGLENLVIEPTEAIDLNNETALESRFELAGIVPQLIELAKIDRSPFQPRQFFNPEKIAKMSESFRHYRAKGTYPKTAILVRPTRDGGYELIFGEQRKIAAQEAGYVDFLAFVDETITDEEALELALKENLLRQDLNSLEKTDAILKLAAVRLQSSPLDIKRLLDKAANDRKSSTDNVIRTEEWLKLESFFQELPDRISPESFRTNYLPLLNLPEEILAVLRQGKLEYTKARAIAKVKNDFHRQQLLQEAIELKLSLEEIRSRIKAFASSNDKPLISEEQLLPKRFISLAKQIQKTKAWSDPKKAKQLQSLLEKLEKLL